MSRYRGAKLRITRRLGYLPGLTQKQSKKKKPLDNILIILIGKKQNIA